MAIGQRPIDAVLHKVWRPLKAGDTRALGTGRTMAIQPESSLGQTADCDKRVAEGGEKRGVGKVSHGHFVLKRRERGEGWENGGE